MKKCNRCGREFRDCAVKQCPVRSYPGNEYQICYLCCMKCKHHTQEGVGIGCDAFVKKSEEPKEKKPRGKKSKRGVLDESQIKL